MFGLTIQKLWGFLNFSRSSDMLAIANGASLSKTAKIYPKTISSRNFEIPRKIEILVFFKKKETSMYRTKNFPYAFFNVKKWPMYVNFSILLCAK
jgi:hypothetical protein